MPLALVGYYHTTTGKLNLKLLFRIVLALMQQVLTKRLKKIMKNVVLCSVARVVHTFPTTEPIVGVTSLDNVLHTARLKAGEPVIEVYSAITYSLLHQLKIPGLKSLDDMTSCKHHRCLYIVDTVSGHVHRVEARAGHYTAKEWPVDEKPAAISVTPQFTVLVTCREVRKLKEITTHGKQLREISLQSDILSPHHATQLPSGNYVVCHGIAEDAAHRVCIVDVEGRLTHAYGGPPGSATIGQFNLPIRLAIDNDGFILVADTNNRRVWLLSQTLCHVREILSRDQLMLMPYRIHLDADNKRLFVAVNQKKRSTCEAGRVIIFGF